MRLASSNAQPIKFYKIGQKPLPSVFNEKELISHIHDIIDNVFDLQRILSSHLDLSVPPTLTPSTPPPPIQTPPRLIRSTPPPSSPISSPSPPTLTRPTPPPSPQPSPLPPSPQPTSILTSSPPMEPDLNQIPLKFQAKDMGSNFKIIKRIGFGSYGFVSTINDPTNLGSIIAMKTIDKFASNIRQEDVETEVQILNYLKQYSKPYFLEFLDLYESHTHFYILTEFLDQYIDLTDPKAEFHFSNSDKKHIISNMIAGLRLLHQLGVVHRDVKLENILIEPKTLNIKYIDFGLSCYGNRCVGYRRIGSQLFMSPELFYDFPLPYRFIDYQKADVWALGMTIVEFLTNSSYYDLFLSTIILPELKTKNIVLYNLVENSKNYNTFAVIEIMNKLLSSPDPFPLNLSSSEMKAYDSVLFRMLHKDPVLRSF